MAGWLYIVSPTKPGTYKYMKLVGRSEDTVVFDRRKSERRQLHQRVTPERRRAERRWRDVMTDLQTSGWVAVRPQAQGAAVSPPAAVSPGSSSAQSSTEQERPRGPLLRLLRTGPFH
jgi:hypothetical protein